MQTRHMSVKSEPDVFAVRTGSAECGFCGRKHYVGRMNSPSKGKTCNRCGKHNHFAVKCRAASGMKPRKPHREGKRANFVAR